MKLQISWSFTGFLSDDEARTEVRMRDEGNGLRLRLDAPWHRNPPPDGPPGPTDALWNHEVVELFLSGAGDPVPYTEIEIGPYGHYLVLRFEGVRQATERLLPAEVTVTRDRRGWHADVRIAGEHLPPRPWRVNLCALHGQGADRRYLSAVPLPGEEPDFHQPDAFLPYVEA